MKPKEKAIELVYKYVGLNSIKLSDYSRIEYPTAKQCALIAVDEILNEYWLQDIQRKDFWTQVKKEINADTTTK